MSDPKVFFPNELYRMIVQRVADLNYGPRQDTLLALAQSFEPLSGLAEEQLYTHPRDLDSTAKQQQFLQAITARSARGTFTQSLRLLWDPSGANSQLLLDIIHGCPNVKFLLIQRGNDINDSTPLPLHCIRSFSMMLDACQHVTSFHFSTILEWTNLFEEEVVGPKHSRMLTDHISAQPHTVRLLGQIETLALSGQSDWVMEGFLPHLTSNLTSLFLSQDCSMGDSPTPFVTLSRQSPRLKSLEFRQTLDTSNDLEAACQAWGNTLEILKISSIADMREWVPQIMQSMKALKILHLGPGCSLSTLSVRAIAISKSPLVEISLGDILPESGDSFEASDETNRAVKELVDAHSSRLQHLELRCADVGRDVLQNCKKASQLHTLDLTVRDPPEPWEVDDLLDACVRLDNFPSWFKRVSVRRSEWDLRLKIRNEVENKWLEQEPAIYRLGT
ncbi:hypothetical protein FIE12Z_12765 [Fusarium flagelliforme]|uniref:Uncharacterized protein n=1 Tax=Fusarium flagelliforme TaxID=2675880 RepID=A0A395M539_9HYPO|nr:hypothetical protein FIE12Z_12765 [Fusarium flagelliforme]